MADRMHFGGDNDRTTAVSRDNPLPIKVSAPGAEQFVSVFGESYVSERIADILIQFQYNLATFDVSSDTSGTGVTEHHDNAAHVHSGVSAGSSVLESVRSLRYRPGHETYGQFTAAFSGTEAGVISIIGVLDQNHGFGLGFNGLDFVVTRRDAGIDDFTSGVEWVDRLDGSGKSKIKLDFTKMYTYRITYGWLGTAPTLFWVYAGFKLGWINFAYIDLGGALSVPVTNNPTSEMRAEVIRASGSGADIYITTASWDAGSIASTQADHVGARHFARNNLKTLSAGVVTNLFTLKSAITFQTKESHISMIPLYVAGALEGTKPGTIEIYRNATLGGTPVYTDIDAGNSVMSIDVAGTTVSGGEFLIGMSLAKTGNDNINLIDLGLEIFPGDTITIAAVSPNTTDARASLRWHELF